MDKITLPVVIFLGLAILAAACTSPQADSQPPAGGQTTAPTIPPTTVTTAPARTLSLVPEPTDVVPSAYAVSVQVTKNTIPTDPSITASFRGGLGLGFTESMEMTVIRSDGTMESESVSNPQMGTDIVIVGTTGTDRVLVYVTFDTGEQYKVFDQDMPFQPINPS